MLKAPFPWFGGKSRVSGLVWRRFGNVKNYIEPFFGSGAVLLQRPSPQGIEVVNDIDRFVANFWRATIHDPEGVAHYCDWPINEADLHARHAWIIQQKTPDFIDRMHSDPDFYDAKIAGFWVWGIASWIGGGWGYGTRRQMPKITWGAGVNRKDVDVDFFRTLRERLRTVRVCCGDWSRVMNSWATRTPCGVFLDPPYSQPDRCRTYDVDDYDVANQAREWAIANGENPQLRIALCGYEGEHQMPDSWTMVAWKANGGYGNFGNGRGRENSKRERIWFSPHCLKDSLFD